MNILRIDRATIQIDEPNKFSFGYDLDSEFCCGYCERKCKFSELNDDPFNDEICPYCGECAEYETESIYDILENQNNNT